MEFYVKNWSNTVRNRCNEQGIYTEEELLKQSWIQINTSEAAEDAVNVDGVGHFFASYDGDQIELDDGTVMYRVN